MKKLLVILILLVANLANAGETIHSLRQNRWSILTNEEFSLQYHVPGFPYGGNDEFYTAKVKLVYNREAQSDMEAWDKWRYTVKFKFFAADGINYNGTEQTLVLEHDGASNIYSDYVLLDITSYTGDPIKIKITDVIGEYDTGSGWTTATNPESDSNIPTDLHLELSVKNERYFDLDPAKTVRLFVQENLTDIKLKWNYVEGAEEYDLEWVYIDEKAAEYAGLLASIGGTYDPELAFKIKEPTSVRVNYNTYTIDKTFPTGLVFFRLRAVGRHTGTGVAGDYTYIHEGIWNYYNISPFDGETGGASSLAYLLIDNTNQFEAGKTWIYSIGFSENGKFASGVSYADGSNRVRQGTAYNSTNDITLKSESKYDYEGRQVVALAPAPVDGRNLAYESGFNTVNAGTEVFNKQHFDTDVKETLDITSGISQYFSPNNTFTQENGGAIPNLNGYVYGQVQYKNDASGRVKTSGGVGETFNIDGSHAINYYYGSPTYVEIKRLFGSDVSDNNNYYRKNMVEDANGMLSVVYTDGSGRTIATGLAGLPPDNLVALDGTIQTYTTPLNTGNIYTNGGNTLESNFQFINTVAGQVITLTYDFTGIIYSYDDLGSPTPTAKCKDCEYTLEITIVDPDGIETLHTETVNYESFTCPSSTYETNFPTEAAAVISDTYTCTQIGEYKIIKRLTVNMPGMLEDITTGVDNSTTLTNLINQYLFAADLSGCYTDPQDYCDYIVEYNYDMEYGAGAYDALVISNPTLAASMIDDCYMEVTATGEIFDGDAEEITNGETVPFEMQCDAFLYAIEQQISPGGPIYEETVASDFWTDVEADLPSGTNTLLLYDTYEAGATQTLIDDITYLQNPIYWQEEWLEFLAPYHREYCHYALCDEQAALLEFDMLWDIFIQTETGGTWSEAELEFLWGVNGTNPDPFVGSDFDPASPNSFYQRLQQFNTSVFVTPCTTATALNPYQYIEELSQCLVDNSEPALSTAQKFAILKGIYTDLKQQMIDEHKAGLTPACDYFNDDFAIFKSGSDIETVLDSDEPGADDFVNNTYDNMDFFVPDVFEVCDNNVASWMSSLPTSCIDALGATGLADLEAAFYSYCYNYCNSTNPGGWFFDHGGTDTYYDAVIAILTDPLTGACPDFEITFETTPPTTDVLTDVVDQNFPICYLNMIAYINEVVLPDTPIADDEYHYSTGHPLLNCGSGDPDAYWIVEGDGEFLTETDGVVKLCEDFFAVQNLVTPFNYFDLNTVSNIHNLFKHADGTVTAFAYISGVLKEVEIHYVPSGCYTPGSFDDMVIMTEMPTDLDITFPNWEADCIDQVQDAAAQEALNAYNNLVEGAQNDFLLHVADCFTGINELFTMEYDLYEYHYTLFYYDLAGNLVKTIPPAGVFPLTPADFPGGVWDLGQPLHDADLFTMYTYNGANMLVESETPDGGITNYYYDDLLRPRFVQDAQQLADNKFSYTIYDELGRPVESGEAGDPGFATINFVADANDYTYPGNALKRDFVKSYFETGYTPDPTIAAVFTNGQQNLINAVGAVEKRTAEYLYSAGTLLPVAGTVVYNITSYSYDSHGMVNEVVQTNTHLSEIGHAHKLIEYDYDLISGNVEEVIYQRGEMDEWRHKYHYDAANRLVRAWTSDDGEEWEMDAKYFYYIHGSLCRVERGHDKVQGTDYAYTDQGWLKGANGTFLDVSKDLGLDGHTTGLDKYSGADAFGYSLGYFDGDYTSNATNTWFASTTYLATQNGTYGNLYNGNISHMVTAMKDENETRINITGNNYRYDMLQRLKSMQVYQVDATGSNYTSYLSTGFTVTTAANSGAYAEAYTYDGNGNIQTLQRYDQNAVLMDNFSYDYDATKINRLLGVDDAVASTVSGVDVDDQPLNNYAYNANGQLTSDAQENITQIDWTADGKVRKITQSDDIEIEFVYDAGGNRVMKIEKGLNMPGAVYTYYVYDAAGNLMATYNRTMEADHILSDEYYTYINDDIYLSERVIYGTGRLGMKNENRKLSHHQFIVEAANDDFYDLIYDDLGSTDYPENFQKEKRKTGEKFYELSNHLNNILEVVTDRKIPNATENGYEADIISYSDYYPFGMVMPGRNGSTDLYRYGFQGQESDDEIKGANNSVNYKYRMHDPRIGRFFATDPLESKYPYNSPYAFSENRVIDAWELEGLEIGGTVSTGANSDVGLIKYNSTVTPAPFGTTNTSISIMPNSNYVFSGSYGYSDPYAGAKIEPYKMHAYDGNWFENLGTLVENSLGGAPLNLGIQLWNEGVDVVNGNASWEATASGFKNMGSNIYSGITNFTFSDLSRWETYELPFAAVVTGGTLSIGRSSLAFTSSTRIGLAPSSFSPGLMMIMRPVSKLPLTPTKIALKQVHGILGGPLTKWQPGKFGSPQYGSALKGYRLDPAHPGRPFGHPESVPHINYWDYTLGKRGSGGISGAIPIFVP